MREAGERFAVEEGSSHARCEMGDGTREGGKRVKLGKKKDLKGCGDEGHGDEWIGAEQRTNILAMHDGIFDRLCQRLHVALSLIQTLAGERMDGMCGVPGTNPLGQLPCTITEQQPRNKNHQNQRGENRK